MSSLNSRLVLQIGEMVVSIAKPTAAAAAAAAVTIPVTLSLPSGFLVDPCKNLSFQRLPLFWWWKCAFQLLKNRKREKECICVNVNVDGESMLFAINPDPEESNLSRTPVEDLFDSIINPDTNPIKSRETQNAQLASELERSQRIWWWILCLVMGLILVESLIANRTYR